MAQALLPHSIIALLSVDLQMDAWPMIDLSMHLVAVSSATEPWHKLSDATRFEMFSTACVGDAMVSRVEL